jgi:polyhydroxyalkanoate synthase
MSRRADQWPDTFLHSPKLVRDAAAARARFLPYCLRAGQGADCLLGVEPHPQDKRFAGEDFLLTQQWWHEAATGVPGVAKHHEDMVAFLARQALDAVSPKNFPLTNAEVIAQTFKDGGMNFVRGALNFWEDWHRLAAGEKPVGAEAF